MSARAAERNELAPRMSEQAPAFSAETLRIDAAPEAQRIRAAIREQVSRRPRKRGIVVGLSGGIDSSVTAAMCGCALAPGPVFALQMPEFDCEPARLRLRADNAP